MVATGADKKGPERGGNGRRNEEAVGFFAEKAGRGELSDPIFVG